MSAFLGVLAGAFVTWLTARHYYRAATRDLKAEATRFAQIIDGVLGGLERSGWYRITRDEAGRPTSITPTLRLGNPPQKSDAGE